MKLGRIVKSGFLVMAFFFAFNSVFGSDNHLLEREKSFSWKEGRCLPMENLSRRRLHTERRERVASHQPIVLASIIAAQVELLLGEVKEVANEERKQSGVSVIPKN